MKFQEEKQNAIDKKTIWKYTKISKILHDIIDAVLILAGLSFVISSILLTLITSTYILPYGFIIPFTDPNTLIGYIINLLYQYFQTYTVVFGFLGFSRIYLTLVIHGCTEIATMVDMINDLNKLILSKNCKKADAEVIEYEEKCYEQLKDIIIFLGNHLM